MEGKHCERKPLGGCRKPCVTLDNAGLLESACGKGGEKFFLVYTIQLHILQLSGREAIVCDRLLYHG